MNGTPLIRHCSLFVTAVSLGAGVPNESGAAAATSTAALPAVQCIYRVLKSSSAVKKVTLYSIDGYRFAIEYSFRINKTKLAFADLEFTVEPDGSLMEGDRIPREESMKTADAALKLESKRNLISKCSLGVAFDNVFPPPKPRADWQRINWPWEH
jgi:hypothetical protein